MTQPTKPHPESEALFDEVPFDKVLNCVHCGLCLEACPTYKTVGVEQDSPRGRLYLMRGLWEGALPLSDEVKAPLDRCLDCRACERACPSNVPYGQLLEQTRGVLAKQAQPKWWARLLKRIAFSVLLTGTHERVGFAQLSAIYQKLGGQKLALSPLGKILPNKLRHAHRLMPRFAFSSFKRKYQKALSPTSKTMQSRKVGLFTGCVMDVADHDIHHASVTLLLAAGCEVVIPQKQGCCGALPVHNGDRETARKLAIDNFDAFPEDLEQIIVNAAGCGAQLHESVELFSEVPDHEGSKRDWSAFSRRFIDISAFLAKDLSWIEANTWHDTPVTVLYDGPCHLVHAQGVTDAPESIISKLPGVTFVKLQNWKDCCGAAGIYNLLQPELSRQILDRKLGDLEQTMAANGAPTYLLTGNPGCIYQWRAGIEQAKLKIEVLHPMQFIVGRLRVS